MATIVLCYSEKDRDAVMNDLKTNSKMVVYWLGPFATVTGSEYKSPDYKALFGIKQNAFVVVGNDKDTGAHKG